MAPRVRLESYPRSIPAGFTVLGLDERADAAAHAKYMSQIKYSDKPRLKRFREFADALFEKRGGVDGVMGGLVVL